MRGSGKDTRLSFDLYNEPARGGTRMSVEERRGEAGKTSFEYARRSRQSADIARSTPLARPSFDLKGRLSLDPELIVRSNDPMRSR